MENQDTAAPGGAVIIGRDGLDALIRTLAAAGYKVIGPTLGDGAIVYGEIALSARSGPHGNAKAGSGGGDTVDGNDKRTVAPRRVMRVLVG